MDTRLYRFVLAGGASTLTTYLVLIAGVEVFSLPAVAVSVIGYALGIVVNYVLNYRYTFNASQRHAAAFPKFLVVMLVGMLANAAIMAAGIELVGLHYAAAQLLAIAVVLSWSYTANRLWTFAS